MINITLDLEDKEGSISFMDKRGHRVSFGIIHCDHPSGTGGTLTEIQDEEGLIKLLAEKIGLDENDEILGEFTYNVVHTATAAFELDGE